MEVYNMGEVIQKRRKSLGITQEQLSEGICSVQTLSRVENGKNRISWEKFKKLMERLGMPSEKYSLVIEVDDIESIEFEKEIFQLINKQEYENAYILFHKLEKKLDKNEKSNQQYLLGIGAILDYQLKKISLQEKMKQLEDAIQITIPCYECRVLKNGVYTRIEIIILYNIALCFQEKDEKKGIRLLKELEEYLEEISINNREYKKLKVVILYNLSHLLRQNGNYEESKKVGNMGVNEGISSTQGNILLLELYNQLYILSLEIKNGDVEKVEEYKELFFQIYYLSDIFENSEMKVCIKRNCDEANIKIDLI